MFGGQFLRIATLHHGLTFNVVPPNFKSILTLRKIQFNPPFKTSVYPTANQDQIVAPYI